jgi:hypothetical protein
MSRMMLVRCGRRKAVFRRRICPTSGHEKTVDRNLD